VMDGWRQSRLGDLVKVKHGWPFKSEQFSTDLTGKPIVVAVGNFHYTGGFRFESTNTKEYRAEYPSEYELSPGDILLIMTCQTSGGEILGIPARVPNDGKTYLHNQRLGKIDFGGSKAIDPGFAYWLFLFPDFNRWLATTASGSKILHTSPGRIEDFTFMLPPLAEQRAIAGVLGALDDKIDANRRMNATLEALARNIYDATPADELLDATLGDLCEVFDGPHATPRTVDEGPIFLGISNLSDGQLDLSDTRHVTEEDYIRWTRRVTPSSGDVLFSYETRLGQAAWLPAGIKCCLGRRMGILRANPRRVPPIILFHAFLSRAFQETIREKTVHGSTVDRIPLVEMPSFAIPIPSPERCDLIAPAVLALRDRICVNAAMMDTLAQLRDLLLPKLLCGALRVRDAERMIGDAA